MYCLVQGVDPALISFSFWNTSSTSCHSTTTGKVAAAESRKILKQIECSIITRLLHPRWLVGCWFWLSLALPELEFEFFVWGRKSMKNQLTWTRGKSFPYSLTVFLVSWSSNFTFIFGSFMESLGMEQWIKCNLRVSNRWIGNLIIMCKESN